MTTETAPAGLVPWFQSVADDFFVRFTAGALHHGLLLSGIEGIGKHTLAEYLSQGLLCQQLTRDGTRSGACGKCQSCMLFSAGSHPDYHKVESEKQIGVDAIRQIIAKLNQTAQLGNNKVCVIYNAHTMTESASNALLKTLEEPTQDTYLILLVNRLNSLLPTVLSRCEKHSLLPPTQKTGIEWMHSVGVSMSDSSGEHLQAFGNAPFRALEAMQSDSALNFTEFTADLDAVLAGNENALNMATKWQEHANVVISWCQIKCHNAYVQDQQILAYDVAKKCINANASLRNPGINKILLLTQIIASLAKIYHSRSED